MDFEMYFNPATYGMDAATFAILSVAATTVIYQIRSRITCIYHWVLSRMYVRFEVGHLDETFAQLDEWVTANLDHSVFPLRSFRQESRVAYEARCEKLRISTTAKDAPPRGITLGECTIILNVPGMPLCSVSKSLKEPEGSSNDPWANTRFSDTPGSYSVKFLGLSRTPIVKLMDDARRLYQSSCEQQIRDRVYRGGYWEDATLSSRSWGSVILPESQKSVILSNVEKFFSPEIEALYKMTEIPYRRGMLLSGPPGTGKTSLIKALKSKTGRRLYQLDLNTISNDANLLDAFAEVEEGSILMLEDVDCIESTMARQNVEGNNKGCDEEGSVGSRAVREVSTSSTKTRMGVTLGGLLNAMDGISTPQGIYLVMTTNCPDNPDPALVRDGRVDVHETIDYLDRDLQEKLVGRILSMDTSYPLVDGSHPEKIPASLIQGACLRALLQSNSDTLDSELVSNLNEEIKKRLEVRSNE